MSRMASNCLPFNISFIFGNRRRSLVARSGEYTGCSNTVICLVARTSNGNQLVVFGREKKNYFIDAWLLRKFFLCFLGLSGFSWFPCLYKQMLRLFSKFQFATTRFSCSPPDLNLLVTNFTFCIHVK